MLQLLDTLHIHRAYKHLVQASTSQIQLDKMFLQDGAFGVHKWYIQPQYI